MSNSFTNKNDQLLLLDLLGFPSDQMLFNPLTKSIIYSLGSNIISYNLISNTKTFVQYLTNEIILLKFLGESQNILLTIDNSSPPILCLWELPSFNQIYLKELYISSQYTFSISNIFFEQMYKDIYIIIITSDIGINYLYLFKNENELNNNFSLDLFGKLPNIKETIFGFKIFFNSKDIIFLLEKNLLYYNLDLDKESCDEKMKIDFPFNLINDSLKINKDINIIAFLTTKGNCLIYDQNGNNKPSINPFGQEYFTSLDFASDSICLGTNNGKIYVYNIYDNKPKFFIHYKAILKIKNNFQLNSRNDLNNKNIYDEKYENNSLLAIKYIYLNEKIGQIFLRLEDNSILFSPLNILIDDLNYNKNEDLKNNNFIFYAFNHSKNIDDIIINFQNGNNSHNITNFDNNSNNQNDNNNDLVIFSCSKDQKIIKYYINYEMNKLSNSFFNLNEILTNIQYKGKIANNNYSNKLNNKHINENMIYLTVLKYHPIYFNKLFAGDNKGFLYLFDTNENKFQYKKPIMGTYEIVLLDFSPDGKILCIGFDTGCQIFCDMNNNCEICLQLNNHYMPVEETEFRKINNQIICFSYFFKNKEKYNDCFLYNKNNYLIEYCQLFYEMNRLSKKEIRTIKIMNPILDIKIHISENYLIILNNTNHIIIYQILSCVITAVIDLNAYVKNAYNIQIDYSGLFLGIICELYNNNENINSNKFIYSISKNGNNKRNYLIFFEIGTGKVKTCLNYNNPISKIIFDNDGNYLIIAGQKGELSLWKLSESMTNNIKYVLEEMKRNIYFWDEYEIKYDNNYDYKNEIVNNSDYVINNRMNNNFSDENFQIKHDIKFNIKNYDKPDMKNSMSSQNNNSINYFKRSAIKNESERNIEYERQYYNTDNLNNIYKSKEEDENKFLNKSELSKNNYNKNYTSVDEKSKNNDNYKYFNSNEAKKAPLLIDSKVFLKENRKDNSKLNNNEMILDKDNYKNNIDYKLDRANKLDKTKNKDELLYKTDNNIKNNNDSKDLKIDYNIYRSKLDDNIKKFGNYNDDLKKNITTNYYKNSITENIKNKTKNEEINGMPYDINISSKNTTSKNNIITSKTNSNRNISKSIKYFNLNTFSQRAPKLKYINLINTKTVNNNKQLESIQTINNKNSNIIFSNENTFPSIEKNEIIRQNNIKKAINRLLDNNPPMNISNFEKQKNIELTINKKNEINFQNDNGYYNIKSNNEYCNNINENFIVINNQKIDLNQFKDNKTNQKNNYKINNNLIVSEIRNKFGISKKYPEPNDIDDNLINSNVEPIPDIEQHNEIQKLDIDELNKIEQKIPMKNEKKNSINENKNDLQFKMNLKEDEDNNKIYHSNKNNNKNNNEINMSYEEFNGTNDNNIFD